MHEYSPYRFVPAYQKLMSACHRRMSACHRCPPYIRTFGHGIFLYRALLQETREKAALIAKTSLQIFIVSIECDYKCYIFCLLNHQKQKILHRRALNVIKQEKGQRQHEDRRLPFEESVYLWPLIVDCARSVLHGCLCDGSWWCWTFRRGWSLCGGHRPKCAFRLQWTCQMAKLLQQLMR